MQLGNRCCGSRCQVCRFDECLWHYAPAYIQLTFSVAEFKRYPGIGAMSPSDCHLIYLGCSEASRNLRPPTFSLQRMCSLIQCDAAYRY